MKRALDEAVVDVRWHCCRGASPPNSSGCGHLDIRQQHGRSPSVPLQLVLEETPLKENHRLVDFKLIIMFFSCVAGCIAQFYPLPFPDNRLLLAACVVVYFLLSAVYQYYTWYIEKDYIFLSKPLVRLDTVACFGDKH